MARLESEGFLVHAYADSKRARVQLLGRLSDGRSFAATKAVPEQTLCVRSVDAARAKAALEGVGIRDALEESALSSFDGYPCLRLRSGVSAMRAVSALAKASIEIFGREEKAAVAFLVRNGIRGGIRIAGEWRAGTGVDVVFSRCGNHAAS